MGIVEIEQDIAAPAERVWAALSDFGNIASFHPHLTSSRLLPGSEPGGVGAARRCDFHDGNHVLERVTDWHEGEALQIEIYEGSMPLARAVGDIWLTPLDTGRCRVHMRMDYAVRYGLAGKVMDALMMRRMFRTRLQELLRALGEHVGGALPAAA